MSSSSGASPSQGWFLAPKKLLATQAVVFIVLVGTLVSGSYLGQRTLSEKGWSLGRWHLSGHKNSTWESEPSLEHLSGSPFEVSPEKEQGTARGLEPEADQGLEPHAVQGPKPPVGVTCEQWLLEADGPVVPGGRNFSDEPVMIFEAELPSYLAASKEELRGCDVACR